MSTGRALTLTLVIHIDPGNNKARAVCVCVCVLPSSVVFVSIAICTNVFRQACTSSRWSTPRSAGARSQIDGPPAAVILANMSMAIYFCAHTIVLRCVCVMWLVVKDVNHHRTGFMDTGRHLTEESFFVCVRVLDVANCNCNYIKSINISANGS